MDGWLSKGGLGAILTLALWAFVWTDAYAQTTPDSGAFLQADGTNALGQGVFVKSSRGCLLVTAAHVVENADFVAWRSEKSSGRARVAQVFGQNGLDIVFLDPIGNPPSACPDVPSPGAAAQTPNGSITLVSATGHLSPVMLAQTAFPPNLAFSPSVPGQSIQAGFSGAGVWSGGVLIGIATDIDSSKAPPKLRVQRFDELPPAAAEWLKPPTAPAWPPFDIRQLPKDAQVMAVGARAAKARADAAYKSALLTIAQADEAAEEGRRLGPKGEGFATVATADWEYAGAVVRDAQGHALPKGPGVMSLLKGTESGRWIECVFLSATQCTGDGRLKDKDGRRWTGPMCGIGGCKVGYYQYPGGYVMILNVNGDAGRQQISALSGVENGTPKVLDEADYDSGVDGVAVSWDIKTGQLISIGQWTKNAFSKNRTSEALAPQ